VDGALKTAPLPCPEAETCKTCPCSDEDDVCFPGERLRAERDRFKEALREIAWEMPTTERNPDGDEQAAYSMQLVARAGLGEPDHELTGTTKPPCLYPLPDGRRCCECASCHPTEEEQRAWLRDGTVPCRGVAQAVLGEGG
jgi:hypothetical protein